MEKSDDEDEKEAEIPEQEEENDDVDGATDLKVVQNHTYAQNYIFDKKHHLWCELTFSVSYIKLSRNII